MRALRPRWAGVLGFLAGYWTEAGRRAAMNLAALVASSAVTQVMAAASMLLLVRSLAPAAFGVLMYALAFQAYVSTFAVSGAFSVMVREAARDPGRVGRVAAAYFVVTLGASVLAAGALGGWAVARAGGAEERWLIGLVMAGSVALAVCPVPLFDVFHRQYRAALINIGCEAAGLAALVALAAAGALDVWTAAAVYVGKWVMVSAGHFAASPLPVRWPDPSAWPDGVDLARKALPLGLAALAIQVPITGGVLFVRWLRGPEEAAVAALAGQVMAVQMLLAGLGARVFQPHVCGPYGTRPEFVRRLVSFWVVYMAAVTAAGLVSSWLVVRYALGPAYRGAFPPIAAGLGAGFLFGLCAVPGTYLLLAGKELGLTAAHVAATAVYAAVCVVAVPALGAVGALAASAVAAGLLLVGVGVGAAASLRGGAAAPPA